MRIFILLALILMSTQAKAANKALAPEPYSHEAIALKNYSGVTLHILTHVPPNIGEPITVHAKEFEKLTGANITITYTPWAEIYPRVMNGLKSGKYDIVTPCSDIIPDTAPYLEPLPASLLASAQWRDIMDYHKKIATYNGKVMQMTIDGDKHSLHYRQDVIGNPNIMAEYKMRYKKALAPPTTWKELNQIAHFLNGKIIDGKKIYGVVEITKMNDLLYSQFIKRASAYAKHPKVQGGFFFDLKTMKPLINTPGWVEALTDFKASQQYYPPGGDNFGLVDVNASFGNGDAVFTDNWDDSFISAMQKDSPCHNKVLMSLSPGSKKVWNRNTQTWDTFKDANRVPFISMGWTSGVSAKSKNKEASFDFLAYASNIVNHRKDLTIGRFGINPFRKSDLDIRFWVEEAGWKEHIAKTYVETLEQQMKVQSKTFDLRIPGSGQYMAALQVAVARALQGRSTPQKALNYAAKEWEQITLRYGRDSQRHHYLPIVKMEDGT